MADRELVIRFIGKDDGLVSISQKGEKSLQGLGNAAKSAEKDSKGLNSVLAGFAAGAAFKAIDILTDSIRQLGSAVVGAFGAALDEFSQFDDASAAASTLVDDTDTLIGKLGEAQDRLNGQVSTTELVASSYDILSAGFTNASEAAEIAEQSSRAAIAGFSDTATTADALTTILNAYNLESSDAAGIVDQLAKTQQLGKITIDQYSQSVGKAVSILSTAGVPLEQFNAAVAASTAAGVAPESAISGIRQAVVNLLKPTKDATDLLKEFGIENAAATLDSEGLVGVLQRLKDAGADNVDLSKIFSDVDALSAIAPIAGDNLFKFTDALEGIENASGTADAAIEDITSSVSGLQKQLETTLREGLLQAGTALNPIREAVLAFTTSVLQAAGAGFDGFGQLTDAAERFNAVLNQNPEIAERIGAVVANIANTVVDQLSQIVDAVTALAGNDAALNGLERDLQGIVDAVVAIGRAARLLVGLADGFSSVRDQAKGIPIIGANITSTFGSALPVLAILKSGIDAIVGAIAAVNGRAVELRAQLGGVRAEAQALSGELGQGLQSGLEDANAALGEGLKNIPTPEIEPPDNTAAVEAVKKTEEELEEERKEALESIETAANKARDIAIEAEQGRLLEIRQLQRDGVLSREQAEEQIAAAATDRIAGELDAERAKLAELQSAAGDNDAEIAKSRQKVNDLSIALVDEEIAAQERLRDAAIKAIEERVELEQVAFAKQIRGIEAIETALKSVSNSFKRQNDLLGARSGLLQAQEASLQNAFDIAASFTEDEKERAAIEEDAARARVAAVDRAAAVEERILKLKIEQQKVQNQIEQAQARAQIAQQQAETAQARGNLEALRADPEATAGQIAAAEDAIAASQQAEQALAQSLQEIQSAGAAIDQLGALELQTQRQNQGAESLSARADLARLTEDTADDDAIRNEALGITETLPNAIQQGFANALRETDGLASQGTNQLFSAQNPIGLTQPLPSLTSQPLTQAIPAQGGVTPQGLQAAFAAAQGQGIGDIQQNNTVNITVTGEQVADGTLAADVESQVLGALSSVLDRTGRSLS